MHKLTEGSPVWVQTLLPVVEQRSHTLLIWPPYGTVLTGGMHDDLTVWIQASNECNMPHLIASSISRRLYVLICETPCRVQAFGDSQDHFDDTEKLRCLQRVLQKAIKTLRKGQRALRCLQPPGQPLGITNSLALPNTTRAFFTRALQDNPALREVNGTHIYVLLLIYKISRVGTPQIQKLRSHLLRIHSYLAIKCCKPGALGHYHQALSASPTARDFLPL